MNKLLRHAKQSHGHFVFYGTHMYSLSISKNEIKDKINVGKITFYILKYWMYKFQTRISLLIYLTNAPAALFSIF
jgi:hypothetical protein